MAGFFSKIIFDPFYIKVAINGDLKIFPFNVLWIKEVAESNLGKSLISLLSAVIRSRQEQELRSNPKSRQGDAMLIFFYIWNTS